MNKNKMLKIVNPLMVILLINQILMALLHGVVPRKVFGFFHMDGGYLFAVVAIIHIALNWSWIKTTYFKKSTNKKV